MMILFQIRKWVTIVLSLLLLCSFPPCVYSATESQVSLPMKIILTKQNYYLGESIPIEIIYSNQATTTVSLKDPAASFEVEMHVIDADTQEDLSYTMGQISTTVFDEAEDQYALVIPEPESIEVAPTSEYRFHSDLNERLFLRAGKFDCFLTDSGNESEHIEINISLKESELPYLMTYAMDTQQEYGRREWAMEWIQELYPEFILKLPLKDSPENVVKEYEQFNQERHKEFIVWMESKKQKGLDEQK